MSIILFLTGLGFGMSLLGLYYTYRAWSIKRKLRGYLEAISGECPAAEQAWLSRHPSVRQD